MQHRAAVHLPYSCSINEERTRQGSARTLAPSTNFNLDGKPLEHRIRMEVALRTFDEDGALRPGPTDERGSMLLAVRVPQDHVEPRTERCGGQPEPEGRAIGAALLQPRSRCTGGPIRAQRFALGERAPRRQTLWESCSSPPPMEPGVVLQPVGLPGKRRSTGKVCVPGLCAGERALLSVSGSQASSLGRQCPLHFRVQRCWRLLRFRTPPPPVRKGPIGRSTPCV
jgi:hypothetical protein